MNFPTNWRDRRTFLAPMHHPFASYSTDSKSEFMKTTFGEDLFMSSLYLGPDPLRKNLADTIIKEEKMAPKNEKNKLEKEKDMKGEEITHMHEDNSRLSGITNFFSGVLNVISNAMFSKRKPADLSSDSGPEMAVPSMWHGAKHLDENKILQDEISDDISSNFFASEMSDCRSAAAHCKSKLEQVRVLLGSSKPVPCSLRVRRRPKKVFVEPSSVEDCFEDAFSPEDFENLSDNSYIEYSSPLCYHEHVLHEAAGPKVKVETPVSPKVASETPKVVAEPPKVPETKETISEAPKMPTINNEMPNIMSEMPKISTLKVPSELNIESSQMVAEEPLVCETMEIVKNVPELITNTNNLVMESKKALVESCEDKITKLKLLLQERRKKPKIVEPEPEPKPEPEPVTLTPTLLEPEPQPLVKLPPKPRPSNKVKDKRFKNPNRCCDKRRKSRMKKNIHDDALFGYELNFEEVSSVENSPSANNMKKYMKKLPKPELNMDICNQTQPKPIPQKEYFDEVSGRFNSASVDSEDSFQIVFNDIPKLRRQSDCDSDDSFIIFEDSPDSCYTSNDVFGDTTDSEDYDSDSDVSDSGCGRFKLSGSLSKSVSNLADDSLYVDHSEDEVDCANRQDFNVCDNVTVSGVGGPGDIGDSCTSRGVLLDERKKLLRKDMPAKRVHFSPNPPKVHVMRVWLYAAKQTRMRYWEQFVLDRDRFKRRIADVDMAVSWVLKPQHRSRVMFQRFMPWWNALKRKEIAEKKEKEAEEKLKQEERLRNEELERKQEEDEENQEQDSKVVLADKDDKIVVNEDSNKNINTVGDRDANNSLGYRDRVAGDSDKVSLVVKEINCHSEGELKEKENVSIDNKNNKLDKKLYSDHIVPYNEKILDLKPDYVSGILDT